MHVSGEQNVGAADRKCAHGRQGFADQIVMLRAGWQIEGMMGDDDLDDMVADCRQLTARQFDLAIIDAPIFNGQ